MAAVRLAPVQALLLCLALLSMSYVKNSSCKPVYTRIELLSLRSNPADVDPQLISTLPAEIQATNNSPCYPNSWRHRPHRSKRRAGVLSRFRKRPYRPPLPALLLSNVRSLRHKTDELFLLMQTNKDYNECSALCLTETWLDDTVSDQVVTPPGFTLHRADRSTLLSTKAKGGGICFMVNQRWCNNDTTLNTLCSPHLEYISVKCRPSYLPREFASVILVGVYIPPSANANTAITELATYISSVENNHPDGAVIVLGDFNHASLSTELPNYIQQVTCPSRGDNTLDHCYVASSEAYRSFPRAPLGNSDHAMLLLIPKYRQKLKSTKVTTKTVKSWSSANIDTLRACFECTDWDVFCPGADANCLEEHYDAMTSWVSPAPPPPFVITEEEVRKEFRKLDKRKAAGPDGVSPAVLSHCANQLAPPFTDLYNSILRHCTAPDCSKDSIIIPVPKSNKITCLNDYRPIALTSVVMKSFERIILSHLKKHTSPLLDTHQFAYRPNRSVEDAANLTLHSTLQHLDSPNTYTRILFMDFSSAFNTIDPVKLYNKMTDMNIHPSLCHLTRSFLWRRRQRVRIGSLLSGPLTLSTGVPQGCVLSPWLFSLYTNHLTSHHSSVSISKYADDTTITGLITNNNEDHYREQVKIYDGRSSGTLRVYHKFLGGQVASYFGHSVAVTDINSDGLDDVLIGAPLYMDRVTEQLQERGQVVVYLQRRNAPFTSRPDQSLIGFSSYGHFGSALAALGDLDMDGYQDVAIGAPWSGEGRRGQVFVYLGKSDGLSATPSQVIDSPLPSSRAAFGFTLRGGADVDGNGYPDLLVGAWGADQAFVYRSQAVIRSRVHFSLLPDFLNPDVKLCQLDNSAVSCFVMQMCVYVSGHRIPQETVLGVELQLDRMKQPLARRTLLLSTNQPYETFELTIQRELGVACVNKTAYLRPEDEVRDKLSPIFITVNISLHNTTQHAVLHGHTHGAIQTRIILDCGDDNVCVPDLRLSAEAAADSVSVGEDQSVLLLVSAENDGEGAYETELVVQVPTHTHYQSTQGLTRLVCVQRKENQTVVVTCDLGNPMRQGYKLQTGLLFSVGHLEEVESHISFNLRIRSKNTVNPDSNKVTVKIQVKAEATLEIRGGSSPPDVILSLPDWPLAMHPGSLQEVGPLVEHVYELRNLGPSAVNSRLTVDFPITRRHHFLLYVFSNAAEESLTCHVLNASQIDPYRLAVNSSAAVVPEFSQQEETTTHSQNRETVHVNCSSSDVECVRFVCEVMELERGFSAVVRISARLWTQTLTETPYLNYELVSSASYDVINASSKVQPVVLPSGHTQTQTNVLWRPDGEKEVPIGYVVLSIISGLLLLGMLCFIFWKLGFFKRTRPPNEDDEDEEQLAEESQYAEMTE
ncbi:integrin alpha-IIb-like [Diretmus argenteus]